MLVLIAHDTGLEGIVDVFPGGTANEWKAKGWKERLRWRFLGDFEKAGRAGGGSEYRVVYSAG